MEAKKEVIRKCVACGLKQDRSIYLRILQEYNTNDFIIRPNSKQFGKSIYVCNQAQCIIKLAKHKKYKDKINFTQLQGELEQNKQYDNCRQN